MAEIIDGKKIAAGVRSEVAGRVADLKRQGQNVRLDVILVGEDPASVTYVRNKENDCAEVGIESHVHRFSEDVPQKELARLVDELNADEEVSGFFIQLPLPDHIDQTKLLSRISPGKDVDGLGPLSAGRLALGLHGLLPCTPHGVLQMLKRTGVEIEGKEAVVLGRSNLVGKPVAQLLLSENATVTICHSRTRNLAEVTRRADILVAAAGKRDIVGPDYVSEGAIVIDVGIHRTEEGKLTGDVDFESVEPKASAITPVPGGVGPMTRAMLLYNTVEAAING